jgi:hypothetical protein
MLALWLVPAAMLLAASAFHFPYGYYTLLRLVVCVCAGIVAYQAWPKQALWTFVFAFVALLFNPLIKVGLSRDTWVPIDVAIGALFIVHGLWTQRRTNAGDGRVQ